MTVASRLVNFFSSVEKYFGFVSLPAALVFFGTRSSQGRSWIGRKHIYIYIYIAAVGLSVFPLRSEAAPRELVYQGRILRPDGSPLEGNIDFLVKIYSPSPSKCLLWAERQTLTMQGSMGAFSLEIGKGDRRLIGADGGGATSFGQVFINHPGLTINSAQCATGFTSYTPGSTDERTISVSFSDAGREIRVVDLPVKSVPFAMQAEQISGYSVNSLFKIAGTAQPGDQPSSLFAKDGVDLLWEIAHNQDFLGRPLKNLGEPVVNSDAATKNYVDSLISQGSMGVITNVTGDANILAGTIGTVRSLSLGTTGVTAGIYGAVGPSGGPTGVSVPVLTVDMWGRITSASQESLPLATTVGGFGLITVDDSSGLILNSGTLGLNLSGLSGVNFGPQTQNVVLAGPLSGGTGAVSFRALDEADIPQLASTGKVQNSATSATPALTNDAIIARDAVGGFKASGAFLNYLALDNGLQAGTSSAILLSAPVSSNSYSLVFPGTAPQNGDMLSFSNSGQMSWVQPGAAGLTSLALSVPAAEMSVSGPVGPGDGTLSLSWRNQNAGLVFAAPTGASGQPSFRQLAASDIATGTFDLARIPDLSVTKIVSGTLGVERGGTGLDGSVATTGQLLIGNGTGGFSLGHLIGGSGVNVTNQAGSIQISAPGAGTLGWAQGGNSFGQTGTLGTNDNQALALQTNGSIRVAITAGGSVGIGMTSPERTLDLLGHMRMVGTAALTPVLDVITQSTSDSGNSYAMRVWRNENAFSGPVLTLGKRSGASSYMPVFEFVNKPHQTNWRGADLRMYGGDVDTGSVSNRSFTRVISMTGDTSNGVAMQFRVQNIADGSALTSANLFEWANGDSVRMAINPEGGLELRHNTGNLGPEFHITATNSNIGSTSMLGAINFRGTDSTLRTGARIVANARGTWPNDVLDAPTSLSFFTQSSGGVDSLAVPRMTIESNGNVGIGVTAPTTALQVAGVISPSEDNTHDLGTATLRFKNIYAANATIQTSDLRQKKDVEDSDLGLEFIGKLRPVSFKWRTGSDTERHYGLIAQYTETAIHESRLEAGGSTSDSQGIVTHDADSDRYGVRYTELIAPIIKAIQELYTRWLSHEHEIALLQQENKAIKAYLCAKEPTAPVCEH